MKGIASSISVSLSVALALAQALTAGLAWAGRPLATEDAAVAEQGTCGVEAWHERGRDTHSLLAATACGVVAGWELGIDVARSSPGRLLEAGWSAKWALADTVSAAEPRPWGLGLKFGSSWGRAAGGRWERSSVWAIGIATLEPARALVLHVNLGATRDPALRQHATTFGAAMVWTGLPRQLLFVEVQANDRAVTFGAAQRTLGWRHWLAGETFGLDFTAGRESGAPGTRFGIGFGWYGL